jgi:hypothetical protein
MGCPQSFLRPRWGMNISYRWVALLFSSQRLMTSLRIHLPGPTRCCRRISIRLLPAQHMKSSFGPTPRYSSHCLGVSLALAQPVVEADELLGPVPVTHRHRVRRFGKRPLQDSGSHPAASFRTARDPPLACTRCVVPA